MNNFILIFFFLALGLLLQRVKQFPRDIYKLLNKFVIYFCLPALALYFIPKIEWSANLLYPIGAAWICFLLSILFFSILGRYYGWSRKLIGCLILTAGFSNTSFLGFPIIEALYGKEGLETAVLVDQPGCFVAISTLGVLIAISYSRGNASATAILKKIMLFPPFITFCIAALMNVFGYDFIDTIQFSLQKIGSLVTPLALFSIGLQLNFDRKSKHFRFLTLGLLFKLFLMPLFLLILYVFILKQNGMQIDVTIMEMAMAPMITSSILASNYGLKPKLSNMMIGFGIPISFVTLLIWAFILNFVN